MPRPRGLSFAPRPPASYVRSLAPPLQLAVCPTAATLAVCWVCADNRISDASAEALGAAIQASTELRTLHLDGEWRQEAVRDNPSTHPLLSAPSHLRWFTVVRQEIASKYVVPLPPIIRVCRQ